MASLNLYTHMDASEVKISARLALDRTSRRGRSGTPNSPKMVPSLTPPRDLPCTPSGPPQTTPFYVTTYYYMESGRSGACRVRFDPFRTARRPCPIFPQIPSPSPPLGIPSPGPGHPLHLPRATSICMQRRFRRNRSLPSPLGPFPHHVHPDPKFTQFPPPLPPSAATIFRGLATPSYPPTPPSYI